MNQNIFVFLVNENPNNLENQLQALYHNFYLKIQSQYLLTVCLLSNSNNKLENHNVISILNKFNNCFINNEDGTFGQKIHSILHFINDVEFTILIQDDKVIQDYTSIIQKLQKPLPTFEAENNKYILTTLTYLREKNALDKRCKNMLESIQDLSIKENPNKEYNISCKWLIEKQNKLKEYIDYPIIYIQGALGDHINSIPLIREYSNGVYICSIYNNVLKSLENVKGIIDSTDKDIGHNVIDDDNKTYNNCFDLYLFCLRTNQNKLYEAYCKLYSKKYINENFTIKDNEMNKLVIQQTQNNIIQELKTNKIITVSIHASKNRDNTASNKNWNDTYWMQLFLYFKKLNYKIIYIGSWRSVQYIPFIDYYFLDKTQDEIISVLRLSDLTLCVDSYIHHLSSAIGVQTICLNPFNNSHAEHDNINYITKRDESIKHYSNRLSVDNEQPERKLSLNKITIEDVIEQSNNILQKQNKLFR